MADEGTGDRRSVRLTQDALRILLDTRPDSKEKSDLIRKAALSPKIHKQLWEKWGTGLPSDASLRHTLLFEWEVPFNENSVDFFIGEYRSTIAFAGFTESDSPVNSAEQVQNEEDGYVPKLGDFVQWERNGELGFAEPKRICELSADGEYAFMEGQLGGIPTAELIKGEPFESKPVLASFSVSEQREPALLDKATQEYVVPLTGGAKATFRWPLSLTIEDVEDLKDSLKILERKITRTLKLVETNDANE